MLARAVLVLCLALHVLAIAPGVNYTYNGGRRRCTVIANGGRVDDTASIMKAFHWCGDKGTIVLPADQTYWIGQKMNPVGRDLQIDWRGKMVLSDNLEYWREEENTYPITYQRHAAAFVISGEKIDIDGHGTGGIDGNGDAWYTDEAGTTRGGRPMAFTFWNVSEVNVKNFYLKDSPLWGINIMNGTNMRFDNIKVTATSTKEPSGGNWTIDTEGFSTMDANNIQLSNYVYQGGADCLAIKPRSYNIIANNLICNSADGPTIGPLGQYREDNTVRNVLISNVQISGNKGTLGTPAYIKTWVGDLVYQNERPYESNWQPAGGGWGSVRNIAFTNFTINSASSGPYITQNYADDGWHGGTSLMDVSNVEFTNFVGSVVDNARFAASVNCTRFAPCYNVDFKGLSLNGAGSVTRRQLQGTCADTEIGGVRGLQGC